MTQQLRRYVIVGSGVAGIAAAQAIRAVDHAGQITIITEDPFGYYSRPGLAYYLTDELSPELLYPMSKSAFQALNVKWVEAQVVRILPAEHQVALSNKSMLTYDRLLLATGSTASPLRAPGGSLSGVYKLDNFTDANAIVKSCRKGRTAVVVGGGITALELVEGLRARGMKVHYFLRGDRYWSNVLDETESRIVENRLQHDGVQLHFNTELAEITGKGVNVAAVRTKDGKVIPCELVAFAIGVVPKKDLAVHGGIEVDRGILADETMRTSQPDIYAAGDVAQVFDPFSGQSVLDTLWNTARSQGHVAGMNMTGNTTKYIKSVPLNVTRLAGITTTIIGSVGRGKDESLTSIARGDSETWRLLPDAVIAEESFEVNRLRIMIGQNYLIGAVVMGSQAMSIPLQELINQRADITPIREALLHSKRVADVIAAFWEQWRTSHAIPQS